MLVDDLPCPLYCFWGDRDTDAVKMVLSHEEYAAGLGRRGVPFDLCPGYDHEGLNSALEVALPAAIEWLRDQAAQESPETSALSVVQRGPPERRQWSWKRCAVPPNHVRARFRRRNGDRCAIPNRRSG